MLNAPAHWDDTAKTEDCDPTMGVDNVFFLRFDRSFGFSCFGGNDWYRSFFFSSGVDDISCLGQCLSIFAMP
jgi:hypothetical protein